MKYHSNSVDTEHVQIRITYSHIEIRLEDNRKIRLNIPVLLALLKHKLGLEM